MIQLIRFFGFREIKPMIIKRILTITLAVMALITSVTIYITPLKVYAVSPEMPPDLSGLTDADIREMRQIIQLYGDIGELEKFIREGVANGTLSVQQAAKAQALVVELKQDALIVANGNTALVGRAAAGAGVIGLGLYAGYELGRHVNWYDVINASTPMVEYNIQNNNSWGWGWENTVNSVNHTIGIFEQVYNNIGVMATGKPWEMTQFEAYKSLWNGIINTLPNSYSGNLEKNHVLPALNFQQTLTLKGARIIDNDWSGIIAVLPLGTAFYDPVCNQRIYEEQRGRFRYTIVDGYSLLGTNRFRTEFHRPDSPLGSERNRQQIIVHVNWTTQQVNNNFPVGYNTRMSYADPDVTHIPVGGGVSVLFVPHTVLGLPAVTIQNNIPNIDRALHELPPQTETVTINMPTVIDDGTKSDFELLYEFLVGMQNMNIPEQIEVANSVPVQPTFPLYNGNDVIDFGNHLKEKLQLVVVSPAIDALLNGLIDKLNQLIVIYQTMPIEWSDTVITDGVLRNVQDWFHEGVRTATWNPPLPWTGTGAPPIPIPWTWTGAPPIPWTQTGVQDMTRIIEIELDRLIPKYGTPPIPPIPPIPPRVPLKIPSFANLASVFPFCIPFDIMAMISMLSEPPEAPVFIFEFPDNIFVGGGIVEWDMSRFDTIAMIFRWFMLIFFIVCLMLITSKVIRW